MPATYAIGLGPTLAGQYSVVKIMIARLRVSAKVQLLLIRVFTPLTGGGIFFWFNVVYIDVFLFRVLHGIGFDLVRDGSTPITPTLCCRCEQAKLVTHSRELIRGAPHSSFLFIVWSTTSRR